jgi:hypothetical protein
VEESDLVVPMIVPTYGMPPDQASSIDGGDSNELLLRESFSGKTVLLLWKGPDDEQPWAIEDYRPDPENPGLAHEIYEEDCSIVDVKLPDPLGELLDRPLAVKHWVLRRGTPYELEIEFADS